MGPVFKAGRRVNLKAEFKPPKTYTHLANETWSSDIPSFHMNVVNLQAIEAENFIRARQIREEQELQAKRRRISRSDYDYDNLPEFEIKTKFRTRRRSSSIQSVENSLKNLDISKGTVENGRKSESFGKTWTRNSSENSRKLQEIDENESENSENLDENKENIENLTKSRTKKSIDIGPEMIEIDENLSENSTKSKTKNLTEFGTKSIENVENVSKNWEKSTKNKKNVENSSKTLTKIKTQKTLEINQESIEIDENLPKILGKLRTKKSIDIDSESFENDENASKNSNKSIKNKKNVENLTKNVTKTRTEKLNENVENVPRNSEKSTKNKKNDENSAKNLAKTTTQKSTELGEKSTENVENASKNLNKSTKNKKNDENSAKNLTKTITQKSTELGEKSIENVENVPKNWEKSTKNKKKDENSAKNLTRTTKKVPNEQKKSMKIVKTAPQNLPDLLENKKMTGKLDYTAILARCRVPSRTGRSEDFSEDDETFEETDKEETTGATSASMATSVYSMNPNVNELNSRPQTAMSAVNDVTEKPLAEACSIIAGSEALRKVRPNSRSRKRNLPSVAYNNESSLTFVNILCSTPFQKTAKNLSTEIEQTAHVTAENDHVTTPPRGHVTQSRPNHVTKSSVLINASPPGHVTSSSMALGQVSSANNQTTPVPDHVTPAANHVTPPTNHVTPKSSKINSLTQNVDFQDENLATGQKNDPKNDSLFTVNGDDTSIKHFFETTRKNFGKLPNDGKRKRKSSLFDTVLPSPELIVPDPRNFTPGCRRSRRIRMKGLGKLEYETDPATKCLRVVGAKKMDLTDLGSFKRYGQLLKPTTYEKRLRLLNKNDFVLQKKQETLSRD